MSSQWNQKVECKCHLCPLEWVRFANQNTCWSDETPSSEDYQVSRRGWASRYCWCLWIHQGKLILGRNSESDWKRTFKRPQVHSCRRHQTGYGNAQFADIQACKWLSGLWGELMDFRMSKPQRYRPHLRRLCIEPECSRKIQSSTKSNIHRCGTCCRLIRRAKEAVSSSLWTRVFNN